MSASEIQIVSREATSKLHVNGNGNLPPDSEKSLDMKAEDTPVTSLETVHLAGDLKISLDTKAPVVEQPYSMAHSMVDLPCVQCPSVKIGNSVASVAMVRLMTGLNMTRP